VIYAAFTLWFFLILFVAIGVHRLWAGLVGARPVGWALLPGTLVAEMAYILGCLITGGEIRRANLFPTRGGPRGGGEAAEPRTEAEPKLKIIGPVFASLLAVVACVAALIVLHSLLGEPVIAEFTGLPGLLGLNSLPKELPTSTEAFWEQLRGQVSLLRRMAGTLVELEWTNWRVPLFVYLTICLSVRLAPVRRDLRGTLAAVVLIAGGIALVGVIWKQFSDLMQDLWPLLTYIWASLLFLLAVTLLVRGVVWLVLVLAGKAEGKK